MNSVPHSSALETSAPAPQQPSREPSAIEQPAGASRLLSRLYRDVGLAAVAAELQVPARSMVGEIALAIERGAALLEARSGDLAA
jgi:hypothetical protein